MKKKCNNCGKDFFKVTKESYGDWNARKFCSHECAWIGRKTRKGSINSEVTRKLISQSKTGKCTKEKNSFYGKKHTDENKKIMSLKKIGQKIGDSHPNWKGGITSINRLLRSSYKYNEWRKLVYERDGYKCVHCGYNKGRILEADHIRPFSEIIEQIKFKHGLSNLYQNAINNNELWDISNGRTLCKPCHQKTDTFSGRTSNHLIRYTN